MTCRPLCSTALAALGAAALAAPLGAQDLIPKAPPQQRAVLITEATVHTVSHGTVEGGALFFQDGVIKAVLDPAAQDELEFPAQGVEMEIVRARGKHVYPGFVCAASVLGLSEIGSVEMTQDTTEAGDATPEVRSAVALNPDSWLIPVTRRNGVLTCGVLPQGGLVSGRAAVVRLDGWTWADMALVDDAGLVIQWPFMGALPRFFRRFRPDAGGDRSAESLRQLDRLFDAAAGYGKARAADPSLAVDLRLEALQPALRGERPLLIEANSRAQIESAVHWAAARGLKPRILGGRDADQCADLLKRHGVSVAVAAAHRLPHRRDLSYADPYELPGRLEAAGLDWCLTMPARGTSNARNLPYEAAACVGFGLDREVALRSITQSAADFLGVGDQLGSLEAGKRATLFVCDGDPFEMDCTIEAAFIDGRRIDLRDKQTELEAKYREKYRQLGILPRPSEKEPAGRD